MKPVNTMHFRATAEAAADSSLFFRGLVFAVAGSIVPWAGLAWYLYRGAI